MRTHLRDAALTYMESGWSVFPLRPREKVPLKGMAVAQFQRVSPADERLIRDWWRVYEFNVAVATGAISDLFVWDCDTAAAYHETVERGIPNTRIAQTGKGYHFYFKYPDFPVGNRAKVCTGVDVRGDGGYVVAPPSVHPSGEQYRWLDDKAPVLPAPSWILALLKAKKTVRTAGKPLPNSFAPHGGAGFRNAALRGEIARLQSASEGERNTALNRAAFSLGQLVAGQELAEGDVIATLASAALSIGLTERE